MHNSKEFWSEYEWDKDDIVWSMCIWCMWCWSWWCEVKNSLRWCILKSMKIQSMKSQHSKYAQQQRIFEWVYIVWSMCIWCMWCWSRWCEVKHCLRWCILKDVLVWYINMMLWKYAQEQRIFEHMAMGQKWDTYVCDMTNFEGVRWDENFFALVHIEKYESREYEEYMCKICTTAKNFGVSMSGTKMT